MRGAHPQEHIRAPSKEEVEAIAQAAGRLRRGRRAGTGHDHAFRRALPGAADFARWLAENGVVPSMGHTQGFGRLCGGVFGGGRLVRGSCVQSIRASGNARAQGRLAHGFRPKRREALRRSDSGRRACRPTRPLGSFVRARGWERTVLTSDLVADAGFEDRGRRAIETSNDTPGDAVYARGRAERQPPRAFGDAPQASKDWSGLDTASALATATRNPARVLGLESALGRLAPGSVREFLYSRFRFPGADRRDD